MFCVTPGGGGTLNFGWAGGRGSTSYGSPVSSNGAMNRPSGPTRGRASTSSVIRAHRNNNASSILVHQHSCEGKEQAASPLSHAGTWLAQESLCHVEYYHILPLSTKKTCRYYLSRKALLSINEFIIPPCLCLVKHDRRQLWNCL